MNLDPERTLAVIACHQSLLLALARLQPNYPRLLILFREETDGFLEVFREKRSPDFVAQFEQQAKDLEAILRQR